MPAYLPDGYSDSESDDSDVLWDPASKSQHNETEPERHTENWLVENITQHSGQDFDCDIRQILETGDEGLVAELLQLARVDTNHQLAGADTNHQLAGADTNHQLAGVDINHQLVSAHSWSLALYVASRGDHKLLRLLLDNGAKIGAGGTETCSGFLALAIVDPDKISEENILKTAEILFETGEDVNITQNQQKTALMLASSYGNQGLVKFLCERGAKLDLTDSQGWSALMFGIDGGHGPVVRTLLEAGASPDLINSEGLSAADLAALRSSPGLQRVVEAYSTKIGLLFHTEEPRAAGAKQMEMESILIGLELEEYKDLFFKHKIGVEEFLTISEETMEEMGVEKVGARKRLLEGQVETHKRSWEKTSIPTLTFADKQSGLRLTCPEAAGVLGNLSRHVTYLKASVAYIRLQVRDHGPRLIQAGSEVVPPSQLIEMVGACSSKLKALDRECSLLARELSILADGNNPPPDTLAAKHRVNLRTKMMVGSIVPALILAFFGMKKFS